MAPHRSAEITFVLDSKKLRDFGLNQTSVYLGERPGQTGCSREGNRGLAVLLPSFDKLTAEQKEQAPKVELSTDLNLGSFNGKKKRKGEILVTNKGKSVLDIRSMQMFTMGLQVQLKKSKIQPGEDREDEGDSRGCRSEEVGVPSILVFS